MQFFSFLPLSPKTKHLRITNDNSTSVSYIKQGDTHSPMDINLTIEIWEIYIKHFSHFSAAHIPSKHNLIADLVSRNYEDSAEWMIFHASLASI